MPEGAVMGFLTGLALAFFLKEFFEFLSNRKAEREEEKEEQEAEENISFSHTLTKLNEDGSRKEIFVCVIKGRDYKFEKLQKGWYEHKAYQVDEHYNKISNVCIKNFYIETEHHVATGKIGRED